MATTNKERPNLKICIDNVDASSDVDISESDDDGVVIDADIGEDSSIGEAGNSDEEDRRKRAAVTKVTAAGCKNRTLSANIKFRGSSPPRRTTEQRVSMSQRLGRKEDPDPVEEKDLKDLYDRLGMTSSDTGERKSTHGVCLDTVHMKGVVGMRTSDVIDYFRPLVPDTVEWIDDQSCNAVWPDGMSAGQALLAVAADVDVKAYTKKDKKGKKRQKKTVTAKTEEAKEKTVEKEGKKGKRVKDKESDDDELNLMSSDEEMEVDSAPVEAASKIDKDSEKTEEKTGEGKKTENEEDGEEGELKEEEEEEEDSSSSDSVEENKGSSTTPPGDWIRGKVTKDGNTIYLRFATNADRKSTSETTTTHTSGSERRKLPTRSAHMDRPQVEVRRIPPQRERQAPDDGEDDEEEEEDEEEEDEDLVAVGLVSSTKRRAAAAAAAAEDDRPARGTTSRIPAETVFDRHTRDAQRERLHQTRVLHKRTRQWSDDEVEDEAASSPGDMDVDMMELLAPSKPKRTMRMYADDVEEEIRNKRLRAETAGILSRKSSWSSSARDIHSRLQLDRRATENAIGRFQWEDEEEEQEEEEGHYEEVYDDDDDDGGGGYYYRRQNHSNYRARRPPPRGGRAQLWRDRDDDGDGDGDGDSPQLDAQAAEKQRRLEQLQRNGIWSRNPDWDKDRYKDLDAPAPEEETLWGLAAPREEFGVDADDLKKRMRAAARESKRTAALDSEDNSSGGSSRRKEGGARQRGSGDFFKSKGIGADDEEEEEEEEEEENEHRNGGHSRQDWRLRSESGIKTGDLRSKLKARRTHPW